MYQLVQNNRTQPLTKILELKLEKLKKKKLLLKSIEMKDCCVHWYFNTDCTESHSHFVTMMSHYDSLILVQVFRK